MKTSLRSLWIGLALASAAVAAETTAPPVYQAAPQAQQLAPSAASAPVAETPAPPPSAPPKRSAAELEQLVGPIALYPDPLIASILPASVYPLEIVQAARFVSDTNNLKKLDAQNWDDNVKAVASVPVVIKKMNDDLQWTIALGEAFVAQDKDVMDAIQTMRGKAQKAGTLQTTPQQIVVVTNMIVEKTVEQRVVIVTNTVVQIQPANPEIIYVPTYSPAVVYYPPPTYVYNPYAPLVTFGVGVAVGAIIANNCDWHHGGVYVGPHGGVVWGSGGYHGDANINVNNTYNRNVNVNNKPPPPPNSPGTRPQPSNPPSQKWQPDQNRMHTSGASGSSAGTMEARGWGSSGARPSTQPSTQPSTGTRPAPSTGSVGNRPSTGTAATRPSTGTAGTRPSTGASAGTRPTAAPSAPSQTANRSASRESAFSGAGNAGSARSSSDRGSMSRSGGFSGGSRGGGGGGRGGRR